MAAARAQRVIAGVHTIVFSPDAARVRTFFADAQNLPSVDAGGGWLIFALPPAELAVHPADGDSHHELYLMCDDIHATLAELRGKGAEVAREITDRAGACWRQSACQMAPNSPFTSPGTYRHSKPDQAHSHAANRVDC